MKVRKTTNIVKFHIVLLFGFIIVIFSSCAFSPVTKPQVEDLGLVILKEYDMNQSSLRKAVEETLIDYEYTIGNTSNRQHSVYKQYELFTHGKVVPIEGISDCGSWNGAPVSGNSGSELFFNFTEISDTKTKLEIRSIISVNFTGRNNYGMVTRREMYQCKSYGIIEDEFLSMLNRKISSNSVVKKNMHTAPIDHSGNMNKEHSPQIKKHSSVLEKGAQATGRDKNSSNRVEKLKAMKELGLLSDEEFNREMEKLDHQ